MEIYWGIISTNHITENWSLPNWDTSRCNFSLWHPVKWAVIHQVRRDAIPQKYNNQRNDKLNAIMICRDVIESVS